MKDKQVLAIVTKAIENDRKAFEHLCELKAREIIYLCVKYQRNQQDGEDAAQEVFIKLQKYIGTLKSPEAFNVWLNRLIYSTCQNMKRNTMKHKDTLQTELVDASLLADTMGTVPQAFVEDGELRAKLLGMIDSLPDKYRQCVLLHYFQALSYQQIAMVLEITPDAVNNNMRMARKILKMMLVDEGYAGKEEKLYSAVPLVALAPALHTIFTKDSAAVASGAVIHSCLAGAGLATGATLAGAGVTAGLGKLMATIAITASVAVAGTGIAVYQSLNRAIPAGGAEPSVSVSPDALGALQPGESTGEFAIAGKVQLDRTGVPDEQAESGLAGLKLVLVPEDDISLELMQLYTSGGEEGGLPQGCFCMDNLEQGRYKIRVYAAQGAQVTQASSCGLEELSGEELLFLMGSGGTANEGEPLPEPVDYRWLSLDGETVFEIGQGSGRLEGLDLELRIPAKLEGKIVLTAGGVPVAYNHSYFPNAVMQLIDPDGNIVMETSVSADGSYVFENPMIAKTGEYAQRFVAGEQAKVNLELPDKLEELYPGYTD